MDSYFHTNVNLNFIFSGNPGTGKTTLARIVGKIFRRFDILTASDENVFSYVTGYDLCRYSSEDVKKLFEDNKGKVLFIDEAYELRKNPRVVYDIVVNLSNADYKGKMSVIMAGYPHDMRQLVDTNSGMRRRFMEVQFTDYTDEQLYAILLNMIASRTDVKMDSDACRTIGIDYIASIPRDKYFGNARLADNLLNVLIENRDSRFVAASPKEQNDFEFARILPCDFPNYSNLD